LLEAGGTAAGDRGLDGHQSESSGLRRAPEGAGRGWRCHPER
jgi:hypothetical protein